MMSRSSRTSRLQIRVPCESGNSSHASVFDGRFSGPLLMTEGVSAPAKILQYMPMEVNVNGNNRAVNRRGIVS